MSRIKSAHSSKDQVHLAKIIEQNIHTIINTRRVTANQRTTEERPCRDSNQLFGAHVF
jgi:predicted component of type VI protein secretion system